MKDWIFVTFPNDGAIPMPIKGIKHWEPSDVEIVGDTAFFTQGETRLSMELKDFEKNFEKYLPY